MLWALPSSDTFSVFNIIRTKNCKRSCPFFENLPSYKIRELRGLEL